MNSGKTAKIMLNISLILQGIYLVLFTAMYVIQKPIWHIFGVAPEIEQLSPVISPAIITVTVITVVLSALLNFALRKGNAPLWLGVLTTVFVVCAFIADRLAKAISCVYYALKLRFLGVNYVVLAGFHENSVQFLDILLLIFLVAGLALLPCAYCVLHFGKRETNS